MRHFEEKTVTYQDNIAATCNKCSRKVESNGSVNGQLWRSKIHNFSLTSSYGSKLEGHVGFDLCDDCLIEFIGTFNHKPEVKEF